MDGKEALKIINENNNIDLILLDIQMPNINGFEVLESIGNSGNNNNTPIILITASTEIEKEEQGLKLGAVDYITKLYNLDILKLKVKNYISIKKYSDLQKENSLVDELTGIANRKKFDETLKTEYTTSKRLLIPLSLLMIDIDHFKNFNDTYGHLKGDEILRVVASTIENMVKRPRDLVARWGGEEFVVILSDTNIEGAMIIAERIRKGIEDLKIFNEIFSSNDLLTVSIGISTYKLEDDLTVEELIAKSDKALYSAKKYGRNKCIY